jgi:hypothetical protein
MYRAGRSSSAKAAVVLVIAILALVFGAGTTAVATSQEKLRYTFDQGIQTEPSSNLRYVVDVSADSTGNNQKGYLKGAYGGVISLVPGNSTQGLVAKFPDPCTATATTVCPKALIETDATRSGELNPGSGPFSFGAWVLMNPSDLTGGSNVMQKGLYNDPGGQWKLQVDTPPGEPGHPSCSMGFVVDGIVEHVYVEAFGVDVADERWHRVVCHKKADNRVYVIVDGVQKNSKPVPEGAVIDNDAPVRVGAKHLSSKDNDQFHGALNNPFFRLG